MPKRSTEATDPVAENAERAVLGGILQDSSLLSDSLVKLSANDFHISAHRTIFATCLEIREQGEKADVPNVSALLEQRGQLEEVGNNSYLVDLENGALSHPSTLRRSAESIINAKRLRNMRRVGAALEEQSRKAGADYALLLEKYRDLIDKLAQGYDLDGNLTPVIPRSLKRRADIVCLADVTAKAVEWLWRPYIPLGMLSMFSGDPSVGKSYVALAIAAALSNGLVPYPHREACTPITTLYLTVENSAEHVLRPRFDLLGGDAKHFQLLRGSITGRDDDPHAERGGITLSDVALLSEALERTRAGFVVVDPVPSFLGANVKMNLANETRPIFDALTRLVEKYHCAMLLLRHLSKGKTGRAIQRGIGTIDFSGAVRSEMFLGHPPDDKQKRAITHEQTNIGPMGPPIGYEIDEQGNFYWKDTDLTTADLLADESDPQERIAVSEAKDFLRDALSKGRRASKEVTKAARDAGITDYTLRQAKYALKVRSEKSTVVDGDWDFVLPDGKK